MAREPTSFRAAVSVSLAGVPQSAVAFEPGACYALVYEKDAARALETLQRLIDAAGFEEAVLAPYLWPRTAPRQLRDELEQLVARGFAGAAGIFCCAEAAGEDAFAAFLLAVAQAACGLSFPVLLTVRAPAALAPETAARMAAAAGLVPVTAVHVPDEAALTDGMRAVADLAALREDPVGEKRADPLAPAAHARGVPVGFAPAA